MGYPSRVGLLFQYRQPLERQLPLEHGPPPCLCSGGLRRIRIHDLRHTYASLLIQNGESLAYVKEQLGHHSIQMTVDVYGHLVPGSNRQAVDRLDDPTSPPAVPTIRNPGATSTVDAVLYPALSSEKGTRNVTVQEEVASNQKIACPVPSAAS